MSALERGQRVSIAGYKATVRYIGPVEGQKGVWVGVEWDDASRGKHDGSTGGVQYFSCRSGATAGSFVRAEKVPAGVVLLEALQARYSNQKAEGGGQQSEGEVFLRTAGNRKVLVQLVGEDQVTARQSQLDQLKSARVVSAGVSRTVVGAGAEQPGRAWRAIRRASLRSRPGGPLPAGRLQQPATAWPPRRQAQAATPPLTDRRRQAASSRGCCQT
jgi:hypothetical protein